MRNMQMEKVLLNTSLKLDDLVNTSLRQEQRQCKSITTLEWNMVSKGGNFGLKLPVLKEYHKKLYYDKCERILIPLHPHPQGSIQLAFWGQKLFCILNSCRRGMKSKQKWTRSKDSTGIREVIPACIAPWNSQVELWFPPGCSCRI